MSHQQLPEYLEERLREDEARFGVNRTQEELNADIKKHTERHEALLKEKAEHARSIGEGHHHSKDLEASVEKKWV